MITLKRLVFCVAFAICAFIVLHASPVYACSGYPYFGADDLPDADVLVKATVVDADDSGHNAVLKVEEYYKGSGSRFVTVMRYPPALRTGALIRGYDTGCLYSGQGQHY